VTLNYLAKYLVTQSTSWPLCGSRASCRKHVKSTEDSSHWHPLSSFRFLWLPLWRWRLQQHQQLMRRRDDATQSLV